MWMTLGASWLNLEANWDAVSMVSRSGEGKSLIVHTG